MARRPVVLDPAAIDEAAHARRWYAERNPDTAAQFMEELDRAVAAIGESPDQWPAHRYGTRRFLLQRFPYALVYQVATTEIRLIALAHGRRRPSYWKRRL